MSPLLEISFLIVFLLWIIPVLSITQISIRAIALGIRRSIGSSRAQEDEHYHLPDESIRPKHLEWRRLHGELVELRMEVAKALVVEMQLKWQVSKEEALSSPNRDTLVALRQQFETQKNQSKFHRERLANLEKDTLRAFTEFQIAISIGRVTAASDRLQGLLTNEAVKSFELLEMQVSRKEVQLYGGGAFEDRYVNFLAIARSLAQLSVELLEKKELEQLLDVLRRATDDIERTIAQGTIFEDAMREEIESNEQKACSCRKDFEEAERSGDEIAADLAWKRRCDYLASAEQFKELLQSSEICTREFARMHKSLKEKDKEISVFVVD